MYTPTQYPQSSFQSSTNQTKPISNPPSIGITAKNPLVTELKKTLELKIQKSPNINKPQNNNNNDSSKPTAIYSLSKDKIFTPPAKAYFILNSLFQSFKKKNEFKLLQQKVHKIEVYHINKNEQESKLSSQPMISESNIQSNFKIRVTPHTIFSSHKAQLTGKQIQKFIQMQRFINPGVKNQLINQILKSIGNLQDIREIMRCYQKLFTTSYCSQSMELKQLVEQKMIKKVLSLDFKQKQEQNQLNYFKQIGNSLMGFPSISQNILYFIGLLYDKVEENHQDYDFLYKIMKNNFSFNIDNLQQALVNLNNKKQIQALIKVNTKENNDLIKSLLRAYTKLREKSPDLSQDKLINVLKIAQTEAHYKLVKLSAQYQKQKQKHKQKQLEAMALLPSVLTNVPPAITNVPTTYVNPLIAPITIAPVAPTTLMVQQATQNLPQVKIQQEKLPLKTQYILKFISDVIKSGCNLWSQTNQWLKTTISSLPQTYLFNQISLHLQKCLSDEKKIKNYILPHIKIISESIQQTSQIYRLWLRHLLKGINEKTAIKEKYLKFTLVKKFILKGILNSTNLTLFAQDIYQPSLQHVELLLDIFVLQKDKAFQFYKQSIENQLLSKHFYAFLNALKQKNPSKLKQWFICADQLKGGELFSSSRYGLIEFIKNNMKIQVAFNWVRDLAIYPPSKFLVWILISLIGVFKQKKQFPALRNCIARTLNLILIRTPCNKLCEEFKKHLPNLAQQFKDFKSDYDIIFADVSKQTLGQLKRAHMQSQGLKF